MSQSDTEAQPPFTDKRPLVFEQRTDTQSVTVTVMTHTSQRHTHARMRRARDHHWQESPYRFWYLSPSLFLSFFFTSLLPYSKSPPTSHTLRLGPYLAFHGLPSLCACAPSPSLSAAGELVLRCVGSHPDWQGDKSSVLNSGWELSLPLRRHLAFVFCFH